MNLHLKAKQKSQKQNINFEWSDPLLRLRIKELTYKTHSIHIIPGFQHQTEDGV